MDININLNINLNDPSDQPPAWATEIMRGILDLGLMMAALQRMQKMTDRTIDDLTADIASETSVESSLVTLTTGLKASLDAALANQGIPADVQTKINAAFDAIEANKTTLANAITANTPAAAPPADGSTGTQAAS
jgi:hypothetical protein